MHRHIYVSHPVPPSVFTAPRDASSAQRLKQAARENKNYILEQRYPILLVSRPAPIVQSRRILCDCTILHDRAIGAERETTISSCHKLHADVHTYITSVSVMGGLPIWCEAPWHQLFAQRNSHFLQDFGWS